MKDPASPHFPLTRQPLSLPLETTLHTAKGAGSRFTTHNP